MHRIDLIIGLPLSGIDEYAERLHKKLHEANESVMFFNSRMKNDGKVDISKYKRLIIADPLLCNYRHLLICEIALTRAFKGVIVVRTYFPNNLEAIQNSSAWFELVPEMQENIITLSREYFPPEDVLNIVNILG